MLPRLCAYIVDRSNSPPMSSTTMPHRHTTRVVSSTFAMTQLRKGQFSHRFAFPEMIIDRPPEMPQTRSARLVCLELEATLVAHRHRGRWRREGGDILRATGSLDRLLDGGGICPPHGRQERVASQTRRSYPWLQHHRYVRSSRCTEDGGSSMHGWNATKTDCAAVLLTWVLWLYVAAAPLAQTRPVLEARAA